MTQYIKYLGKAGNDLLSQLLLAGKRPFTISEAGQFYGEKPGLRAMLSALVKNGWLQRIERGKYLILPLEAGSTGQWSEHEFVVASCLIQPYYIGFQSALSYYGYSEKVSKTVYIVSPRRKLKSLLNISGVAYQFVNLDNRQFFGIKEIAIGNQQVNLSDREKTLIDCLSMQDYCGGVDSVAQTLWYGYKELDFQRLARYAVKSGNKAVCQRLGYLMETLNLKKPEAVSNLYDNVSGSYARLDTLAPNQGPYISKWKIRVNVPESDLQKWRMD
jgi:predicted transcriptional regulator of viral defense system